MDDCKLTFVNSMEEANNFMRWLGERRHVMAVDTESSGLSPWTEELRLVQFGDHEHGWSIPWAEWGGVAREALNRYEGRIVMHNLAHDWKWFKVAAGIELDWSRLDDTMIKAFIDDSSRTKALKSLCAIFFGNAAVAGQDSLKDAMKKNGWTWGTVPIDHPYYWGYGALDTVLTARLDEKLSDRIFPAFNDAYQLEMAALRVCTNMSVKGCRVDIEYCERKIKELTDWAQSARRWCTENFGVKNVGSTQQLIERFLKDGIEFHRYTDKGNIQLNAEVLESLEDVHPLAATVLKIRKAEKIVGSYLENMIRLADSEGYVHPSINTVGARTGRMSITDPAFQTLHRDDQTVRGAVLASEGNLLVKCDASQEEARLFAHFSEDERFIQAFKSGDFFCNISSIVFKETITKDDPRRAIMKTLVYAMCYGSGVATMARSAKVPYEEMVDIVDELHREFPGVPDFIRKAERLGKDRAPRPYIMTDAGHRLYGDRGREYALTNYLIQGTAAAVLKRNLVELDSMGYGDEMMIPVHDEIVLDVPEAEAADVAARVEKDMYDGDSYSVPLLWESEVKGKSWGRRSDVHIDPQEMDMRIAKMRVHDVLDEVVEKYDAEFASQVLEQVSAERETL